MKIHPHDVALEELFLSLGESQRAVMKHLSRCEVCAEKFESFWRRAPGKKDEGLATVLHWPAPDYSPALKRNQEVFQAQKKELRRERAEAPGLFVELTGYPPEQWEAVLRNSGRFHTWGLFELVVERSLEVAGREPEAAENLGRLALRISDHLDTTSYRQELIEDLRARAWSYIGNARRVKSDFFRAEVAFAAAYAHLMKGTRDYFERAVYLDLKASLLRAQRRFEDAFKLLHRAVSLFREIGHSHRAGRSLVNMATVHHHSGNPEAGIPLLQEALELIDPEQEPRLLLCARHNLIDYMAASGRFLEAQALYRETRPLYRDFPDAWAQNRRKWVKGKIVRGLGQPQLAESLFLAARDGFIAEGVPYDTALVSLEIATLYAEQGRTADLKRLAEEMVPIFSSLQIHREALAALAFLKQAIEAEEATLDVVTAVGDYLSRARYQSELRFQPPA